MLRLFAVLALVVVTSPAAAQDGWPSKPITVIVPFGAGGNTDGPLEFIQRGYPHISASSS